MIKNMKEGLQMKIEYEREEFWKNYMLRWFGEDLIDKWVRYAELTTIDSVNGPINAEVYRADDSSSPTVVFSHGIAGYARLLLPFIIPLLEKGYNVVAPDLEGFGYNGRRKGDFCWDEHLENLRDTVALTRTLFSGPVYLGGGSMGGPLAYAADARYNCADGLICWCLWDFADREFIKDSSTMGRATFVLMPLLRVISVLFGKLPFKTTRFVPYRALTADPEFNELIMRDPQAGNRTTLRGALSMILDSKPDVDHSAYEKPVLVCNPELDEMTKNIYTKRVFDKLKSKNKKYAGFQTAHFPLDRQSFLAWADDVDAFIRDIDRASLYI
jgi:pimeloyl-ACP methyl ester carboxylesterase